MAGFVNRDVLSLLRGVLGRFGEADFDVEACLAQVGNAQSVALVSQREQECLVEQPFDRSRRITNRRGRQVGAGDIVDAEIVHLGLEEEIDQLSSLPTSREGKVE